MGNTCKGQQPVHHGHCERAFEIQSPSTQKLQNQKLDQKIFLELEIDQEYTEPKINNIQDNEYMKKYSKSIRNFLQYQNFKQQETPKPKQNILQNYDQYISELYVKKNKGLNYNMTDQQFKQDFLRKSIQKNQKWNKENQNYQELSINNFDSNTNTNFSNNIYIIQKNHKQDQQINSPKFQSQKSNRQKKSKSISNLTLQNYNSARDRVKSINLNSNQSNDSQKIYEFTKQKYKQLPEVVKKNTERKKSMDKIQFFKERKEKVKQLDYKAKQLLKQYLQ